MGTRSEKRERKLRLAHELARTAQRKGQTKARRAPVEFQADLTVRVHRQRMESERE